MWGIIRKSIIIYYYYISVNGNIVEVLIILI